MNTVTAEYIAIVMILMRLLKMSSCLEKWPERLLGAACNLLWGLIMEESPRKSVCDSIETCLHYQKVTFCVTVFYKHTFVLEIAPGWVLKSNLYWQYHNSWDCFCCLLPQFGSHWLKKRLKSISTYYN